MYLTIKVGFYIAKNREYAACKKYFGSKILVIFTAYKIIKQR